MDLWRGGIAQEKADEEEVNRAEKKTVIDIRKIGRASCRERVLLSV